MSAQGQAGRRADGWISMEDREPEPWKLVLAYDGFSVDTAMHSGRTTCEWPSSWLADTGACVAENITHWQPLPDPPLADGEGEE